MLADSRIQQLERVLAFQKEALAALAEALRMTENAIRQERASAERADQLASYLTAPAPNYGVEALVRIEEDDDGK